MTCGLINVFVIASFYSLLQNKINTEKIMKNKPENELVTSNNYEMKKTVWSTVFVVLIWFITFAWALNQ